MLNFSFTITLVHNLFLSFHTIFLFCSTTYLSIHIWICNLEIQSINIYILSLNVSDYTNKCICLYVISGEKIVNGISFFVILGYVQYASSVCYNHD